MEIKIERDADGRRCRRYEAAGRTLCLVEAAEGFEIVGRPDRLPLPIPVRRAADLLGCVKGAADDQGRALGGERGHLQFMPGTRNTISVEATRGWDNIEVARSVYSSVDLWLAVAEDLAALGRGTPWTALAGAKWEDLVGEALVAHAGSLRESLRIPRA